MSLKRKIVLTVTYHGATVYKGSRYGCTDR